jgi:hypothetical protein
MERSFLILLVLLAVILPALAILSNRESFIVHRSFLCAP